MRLSAFTVSESNAQLLIDMTKLYLPYCDDEKEIEATFHNILNDKDQQLFVASFNERHIAAVCIKQINQQLNLANFTVRDITQKRGIGKFLLTECKKIAAEKNCNQLIIEFQSTVHESLGLFLIAQGFNITEDGYKLAI